MISASDVKVFLFCVCSSLQVFETESHAYTHSGAMKEGLSLYGEALLQIFFLGPFRKASDLIPFLHLTSVPFPSGILNSTRTPMGKSLFRSWLLRPLMDIPTLSLRHDFVSLFSRVENRKSVEEIKSHLTRMADSQRLMRNLRKGNMRVGDWKKLLEFALKMPQIKECSTELIGPYSGVMQRKVRSLSDIFFGFRSLSRPI
jgi:DNA mismatch repair protein MSH5